MKDQKKAKKYYSGKKKKHTQKAQIITNIKGKILAVTIAKGKMHDFRLFKNSNPTKKILMSRVLADLGYLGIDKICPNATIPNKKTKKKPLTKEEKKENHKLSSNRIIIENINAKIKVFKITKYPYRNRRKRFGLRMNLICAIINLDLIPLNTDSGKD
ncbi:MAG: transposase family protein [Sulfurimonas sp.]|nr:transposase family protein [Sulfurimonas sp.]